MGKDREKARVDVSKSDLITETASGKRSGLSYFLNWPWWILWPAVFVLFAVIAYGRLDPDFGWHLMTGRYYLAHGIPKTDFLSYTASTFSFIDHEWLMNVMMEKLYGVGGYISLVVLFSFLWTVSFWLVTRRKFAGVRVNSYIVLAAVLLVLPFAGVRAVTWTVLFFAILLNLLNLWHTKVHHGQRAGLTTGFLVLFLVLVNFHGDSPVGLAVVALSAFLYRDRKLAVLLIFCIATTFINPYGVGVWVEFWRQLSDTQLHFRISEWTPIWYSLHLATLPFLVLFGVGFLWKLSTAFRTFHKNKKRSFHYGMINLLRFAQKDWRLFISIENVFFLTALSAQRNWPIFAITAIAPTAKSICTIQKALPPSDKLPKISKRGGIVIGCAMLMFGCWQAGQLVIYSGPREASYPQAIVSYLQQNPCSGQLFNEYDVGGYLLWKLPEKKVFIDGRMPSWELSKSDISFYPGLHRYMDVYLKVRDDKDEVFRRMVFQKYDISCVLVGKNSSLTKHLSAENWHTAQQDDAWVLLLKDAPRQEQQ
jgi:NADH:ubiquinone oxidoreductase subunit K